MHVRKLEFLRESDELLRCGVEYSKLRKWEQQKKLKGWEYCREEKEAVWYVVEMMMGIIGNGVGQ